MNTGTHGESRLAKPRFYYIHTVGRNQEVVCFTPHYMYKHKILKAYIRVNIVLKI